MAGLFTMALLIVAAVAWVVVGRVDPEQELEMLSPGSSARLIEAEIKRTPSLSRGEAAKRVLQALRRDSQ